MYRQFRSIEKGEYIIVVADCSQGGSDHNFAHFISKTRLDIPLVYQKKSVAAEMTSDLHPIIEKIYDITNVKPLVCFERNNGGASEMQRLDVLNRSNKYELYKSKRIGEDRSEADRETGRFGWDTTSANRPTMVGDWQLAFRERALIIYDVETINQHKTFIVDRRDKPIAARGKRDDAVMSLTIGWQLVQSSQSPLMTDHELEEYIHEDLAQRQKDKLKFRIGI